METGRPAFLTRVRREAVETGMDTMRGISRNSPSLLVLSADRSREPPKAYQVSRASAAFQFTFRKNAAM